MPQQPRGRRQNCEDLLLADLVHVARGQRPEHGREEFKKADYNNPAKSVGGAGSNNWDRDALGVRYVVNWREFGIEPRLDALEVFEVSKVKYGGREIDSTHYEDLTAPADLAIQKAAKARGDREVYEEALDHNRYRAARFLAFWSERTGGTAKVGQRSAGGAWARGNFIDYVVLLGMGWPGAPTDKLARWRAMDVSDVENHRGGYPSYAMLAICLEEIREAFEPFRGHGGVQEARERAFAWLRDHPRKSIIPVTVREAPGELAVWMERDIMSATEAVLAGVETDASWEHAPRWRGAEGPDPEDENDPHRRSRHGFGAHLEEVGEALIYTPHAGPDGKPPVYEPRRLALRPGPTRFVDIGGEWGYRDRLAKAPPAPSPNPNPTPAPPPRKGCLIWFAALAPLLWAGAVAALAALARWAP